MDGTVRAIRAASRTKTGRPASGRRRVRAERLGRGEGVAERGVVGDVEGEAGGRPGAAGDLGDRADAIAGEDRGTAALLQRPRRHDLLDRDEHFSGGADHRPVLGAGAVDFDIAERVGAGRVEDDGVEAQRRNDPDRLARDGVACDDRTGDQLHHVGAGGKLEGEGRQVGLAGAERLDHGERGPVADRHGAGFGGGAEVLRKTKYVEARKADVDARDGPGLEQHFERQATRPGDIAEALRRALGDGAEEGDRQPGEVVSADAEGVAVADHGREPGEVGDERPVRLDQALPDFGHGIHNASASMR